MNWLEITVNTESSFIDLLTAKLDDLGVSGLIIEDENEYRDFLENNKKYWDYVDEDLEKSWAGMSRIKFYLEDSDDGKKELTRLRTLLPEYELTSARVKDEDWENNWKQYYKPVRTGEKLLIVPSWEETPETEGRTVMRLDPGLIFGTGTHPTTKMCLEVIERLAHPGIEVLDLGCGSGILAIAALLFGADKAYGCDIDPKAPDIVMENAQLNGIYGDRFIVRDGDVLSDSAMRRDYGAKKYALITANIVADVIIALCPTAKEWLAEDGTFICSGIIDDRAAETEAKLRECGFEIVESHEEDDWHCYVCR